MSETTTPVIITRVLNAPVQKVWAAVTEPEQLKKWWGPKDFTAPSIQADLRVGGKYLFCMRGKIAPDAPEQDFWSTGTYDEIIPFQRLVCSDSFGDAQGNIVPAANYGLQSFPDVMRITFDFEQQDDGTTKLTITHDGAPAGPDADNMEQGWNQSLDKLAESLK